MQQALVIGRVSDVASGGAVVRLDAAVLERLRSDTDSALALAGAVGGQVKIRSGATWLLGTIQATRSDAGGEVLAEIDLIGESEAAADGTLVDFRRGITGYPRSGDAVWAVGHDDLAALFGASNQPHIDVGTVYPTPDIRATLLIDQMLGKHFAVVGSTGSGKSTATALILHRIIEMAPHGHILVLDPHGEYASAFASNGSNFSVDNLDLPYWLMNFEEHCEVFITSDGVERELDKAILARSLIEARAKSMIADRFPSMTVDSPVPYMLGDLLGALIGHMGKLEHGSEVARYVRLKNRIEEILRDSRYSFMFKRELSSDSMKGFLGRILRMPGDGKPISVVDLSGVPTDIVAVVVALLSRIVADYAMWARSERQRPILLVCEEAHRYLPSERVATGSAVRKVLERIAKEGRKYGVSLALITQRPSDLAEGALSQCGTIIAMRLNNERDQSCVRNAMPEGGRGFLDSIPALRRGECLICGEGVTVPMRVLIDAPEAHKRPHSGDPSFAALWSQAGGEDAMLDRVIYRWRTQSERPQENVVVVAPETFSRLLLRPVASGED